MSIHFTHDTFLTPFTWRYGSAGMRAIWSEVHKRRLWRRIWVSLAEAQQPAGLVSADQVADLRAHAHQVDVALAHAIEAEIHHDLMAEIRVFAGQCPVGGGVIHLGATSADVEDNADALRLRGALDLVLERLAVVQEGLSQQIERWAETPALGWTHLQPAEPTTLGYRMAQYGQDLMMDHAQLRQVRNAIRGKGLKGAVGTSASFAQLLAGSGITPAELESRVMATLDLPSFAVTTQTYPRKQDWLVLNALAGLAGSLYRLAFDLRLLQSPSLGEWSEPFESAQVGSSAMPFKRNPINAENMGSLARLVAAFPRVAWDNAAHSLLERTLDDSANRRVILPEAFLATDELLIRADRVVRALQVNEAAVARNLGAYGAFAATEPVMMELVRSGADRQVMHELIRGHCMAAWTAVAAGEANPLPQLLASDPEIRQFISEARVLELMDVTGYIGDAPSRARALAARIRRESGAS